MTTYGTIPSSSSEFSTKDRVKSGLTTRAPWNLMFNFRSFTLPFNFTDTISRIKINLTYFRTNYAIIVIFLFLLSLLWHPFALMLFFFMDRAWYSFYFLRDEPLVLFGRSIDDRVVLTVLLVLTIVLLLLTNVTLNFLISILIGAVLVLVHAAVRKTEDLFLDEEAASTGLISPPSSNSRLLNVVSTSSLS